MRSLQPPSLLCFILALIPQPSIARPKIPDELKELLESRYHYLSERDCAKPCGWAEPGSPAPLCCGADQSCGTNTLGQAVCNSGVSAQADNQGDPDQPGVETIVTTIVESGLVTRTTTYSTSFGAAPTAAAGGAQVSSISCQTEIGEKPCGTICCAVGQTCAYAGQCAASNDDTDGSSSLLGSIFTPAAAAPTNTPALRPTSVEPTTVTETGSATTTVHYSTPSPAAATASSGAAAAGATTTTNGLSGGAIAGIVIGVLAALIIIGLLLFCCCAASAGNALLVCLGLGKRRRRKDTVVVEEHRHHHGSSGGAVTGRRWWGLGPPRRTEVVEKKKKSKVGGMTAVAGGLTTLAIILGLKRKRDRKQRSEYGTSTDYSYYSSSYGSSESSRSDDRYTRRSGRTGSRRL